MKRPSSPRVACNAPLAIEARTATGRADKARGSIRRNTLALAVTALLGSGALALPGEAAAQGRGRTDAPGQQVAPALKFAPGRILVEAKAGVTDSQFEATLAAHGGRSLGRLRGLKTHVMSVPPGQSEQKILEKLARHPHVEFAELDQLLPPGATTNDPLVASQWHLAKISAATAWDRSIGTGTIIAILDTGVDASHPDLAPQMVPGWNVYDNNADSSDVHGHGTSVAGTAAALGNNATGVASVSWGARIMPVRISDPSGYGYFSTIAQGITWAADNGARVVNISYGVSSSSTVRSAADAMRSKGGVVVVAAGNSGADTGGTASDSLVVVSATGSSDSRTSWSSFGADVDLAAPGEGIYTTARGGGYASVAGTSFASPVVAGAAALVKSLRPDFTAAQIEAALLSSAVDLGAAGKDPYYGNGRLDAAAAVSAAAAAVAADTTAPKAAIASPTGGTVSGAVAVGVNASDNVGVTRVELLANGNLVGTDTTAPYSFVWDTATVANGTVALTAVAYDSAGNSGRSTPVSVTVSNNTTTSVAPDTTPPTVAILSPSSGTEVISGNVTVSARATDTGGLAWTQLAIDGVTVASTTTGTLNYKWNTRRVKSGSHTITVTASDKAGNTASSSTTVYR